MVTKRNLITFALVGLLIAPAVSAQTSNVQIYGRVNAGVDQYQATGSRVANADYKSRTRVWDQGSRLGVRGTEDLGGGLKAVFQIESGVNIDTGATTGQAATANSSTGTFASRDSYLGLDGSYGRLVMGRFSVYEPSRITPNHAFYINTQIPWAVINLFGRLPIAPARTSNIVQYQTPNMSGVEAQLSYSPSGEAVGTVGGGVNPDGSQWVLTVRGTFGPVLVQGDYASVQGNSSTTGAVRSKATFGKLGARWYYMPGAAVGGVVYRTQANTTIDASTAPGDQINQSAWQLNWEHTFGNVQLMAELGATGDMKGCDTATISCNNTSAKAWLIGARYLFSKRTWGYVSYTETKNRENTFADYGGGNVTSVSVPGGGPRPYGADPRIIAVGMMHQF